MEEQKQPLQHDSSDVKCCYEMSATKLPKRATSMRMGTNDKEVSDIWGEQWEDPGTERRNSMQNILIEIATRRMSGMVVENQGAREIINRRLSMH